MLGVDQRGIPVAYTSTFFSREVTITLGFLPAILALNDKPAPHVSTAHPDNSYMSTLFCAISNFGNENGALTLNILESSGNGGRVSYSIPYEPGI